MEFTIQVAEQKQHGLVSAAKDSKAAELKRLGLKSWPTGWSSLIDEAVSFAKSVAESGTLGDGPFHVVVDGRYDAGPRETPTLSVGISSQAQPPADEVGFEAPPLDHAIFDVETARKERGLPDEADYELSWPPHPQQLGDVVDDAPRRRRRKTA